MIRLFLRFIGLCLLAAAFVTLIVDATRSATSGTLYVTSIGESFMAVLPSHFGLAQAFIERHIHPLVWDPIMVDLLRLPVWLAFGIAGALAIRLGSRPASKFGFSSR